MVGLRANGLKYDLHVELLPNRKMQINKICCLLYLKHLFGFLLYTICSYMICCGLSGNLFAYFIRKQVNKKVDT